MRSASPRWGTQRPPDFRLEGRARSFSASASPRAATAGRCASKTCGCPDGSGSSSAPRPGRGGHRAPRARSSGPVRLPDDIAAGIGGTRSSGAASRASSRGSSRSAVARRREHDRLVERMKRPLRERRERANRLDLVAEELDPDGSRPVARRRRRAHRAQRTPAALDALDPLVSSEREPLDQPVDPRLVADRDRKRRRPRLDGRNPCANPSADAQTRPPRETRSSARARSPTRCGGGSRPLSCVTPRDARRPTCSLPRNQPTASATSRASASSGSRQTRPRAAPGEPEGGEQEGKERLGDARPGPARRRESSEPLRVGELGGERPERRLLDARTRNARILCGRHPCGLARGSPGGAQLARRLRGPPHATTRYQRNVGRRAGVARS